MNKLVLQLNLTIIIIITTIINVSKILFGMLIAIDLKIKDVGTRASRQGR